MLITMGPLGTHLPGKLCRTFQQCWLRPGHEPDSPSPSLKTILFPHPSSNSHEDITNPASSSCILALSLFIIRLPCSNMASFDDGGIGISSAELWQMVYPTIPIPFKHELRPVPQSSADQSGMAPPQGNGPGVSSAFGWQAAQPSRQMPGLVQHAVHGNGPGVSSVFGWQTALPSYQMRSLVQQAVHGNLSPSALPPTGWINSPGKVPVMIPCAFFELPPPTKYRCAECEAEFDAELPLRNHQLATKHERQKVSMPADCS